MGTITSEDNTILSNCLTASIITTGKEKRFIDDLSLKQTKKSRKKMKKERRRLPSIATYSDVIFTLQLRMRTVSPRKIAVNQKIKIQIKNQTKIKGGATPPATDWS